MPLAFLLKNANSSIATDPTPAAPKEDVALCQNSTDMPNLDIYSTNVSDTAACKALCEETAACVAFVVDACQAPVRNTITFILSLNIKVQMYRKDERRGSENRGPV